MYPPIFQLCSANPEVQSIFGSSPCKIYKFGSAPQKGTQFYSLPYAVWRVITGTPENYLDKAPDIDNPLIQVDIYAATSSEAIDGANVIRDVIEKVAHITSWNGDDRDPETLNYNVSFDVSWFVNR